MAKKEKKPRKTRTTTRIFLIDGTPVLCSSVNLGDAMAAVPEDSGLPSWCKFNLALDIEVAKVVKAIIAPKPVSQGPERF